MSYNNIKNMVLGFCFSPDLNKVVLIKKTKPSWQLGLLNGVGGKIEEGENPEEAIVREFEEETGVKIEKWNLFAEMILVTNPEEGKEDRPGIFIDCFYTIGSPNVKSITEEKVDWYKIDDLWIYKSVPNLKWLIPMAEDKITNPNSFELARLIYRQ